MVDPVEASGCSALTLEDCSGLTGNRVDDVAWRRGPSRPPVLLHGAG